MFLFNQIRATANLKNSVDSQTEQTTLSVRKCIVKKRL